MDHFIQKSKETPTSSILTPLHHCCHCLTSQGKWVGPM